jgi:outer membrane protein, multidrug efflux system
MRYSLLAICTAILAVSGCTVGPDYKTPDVNTPGRFSIGDANHPSTAPDISQWWNSLNDTMLTSLIEEARTSNLDLRIAAARIAQARAAAGIVDSAQMPTVNMYGAYTDTRVTKNTDLGPFYPRREFPDYQTGFDASWEIDVFGGTRRAVEAAKADVQAAVASDRDVLVTLTAEIARTYITLRQYQRRLVIANENAGLQRGTLEIVEGRYKAGLTSELDVQRANAQLQATLAVIPSTQTAIAVSRHRLAVLLGKEPGALDARLAQANPIPATQPVVPVGLPSDLLRRRPDIRRAERQLAAANARIGVATSDLFPKFALTGSFGQESSNTGNLFDHSSRFWSITPGFSWPVFDGDRIKSNIRFQTARQEEAMAVYIKSVLNALEETENSLTAYGNERVRMEHIASAVAANRRSVQLASALYAQGLADFLTLLDAQRVLFIAEDQLAESQAATATDLVALYKAMGGGWNPEQ